MLKKVMKSAAAAKAASFLMGAYIHFVYGTSPWKIIDRHFYDDAAAREKGVIIAFWHHQLMIAPRVRRETDRRFYMLISAHRDGDIITDSVRSFDLDFIRGSAANPKKAHKDKGGATASVQIIAALRDGHVVGMTPDGPRGPRERANMGVVRLSQISQAPIIPIGLSVSRGRRLNTWDGFLLAWPFSKGVCVASDPIEPPAENDDSALESTRQSVENALISVTRRADEITGRQGRSQSRESTQS